MKIGIIIFSHTGNTNILAQKLQETLSSKGYTVSLENVTQKGTKTPDNRNVQLEFSPDTDKYDMVIFGSPVWGFSLSSVMSAYLKQVTSLNNKNTICFVTKALSSTWTGGNRAVKQMKKIVTAKGANVIGTEIVFQRNIKKENELNITIEKLSNYITV